MPRRDLPCIDDDFDDIDPTDLDAMAAEPGEGPDLRATIANGRITVVRWFPTLFRPMGPLGNFFRLREASGVTIADLTSYEAAGGRELIVEYLAKGGGATAERALLRWAERLRYSRVWLPNRVVEVDRFRGALGSARVECPTCSADWEDHSPEFWAGVYAEGCFPVTCPLCGSDLPQWTVRAKRWSPAVIARARRRYRESSERE